MTNSLSMSFRRSWECPSYSFSVLSVASALSSRGCGHLALDERQQIRVDLLRIGCAHAMRKARIDLQPGVLHNLRRHQPRCADRDDLVVVAMKDESGHVY